MALTPSILMVSLLPLLPGGPDYSGIFDNERDGVIILEGKYQERNIYVQNAYGSEGVGYCAFEIRVNGDLITDQVNSSAFEIDLTSFNLNVGDDVTIEIRHQSGCTPKVINPGHLKPKATFNATDISISEDGFLEWVTTDEFGALPFMVQQYKWNKWINVGEVEGKGTPETNNYAFHVDFVSGKNKFRVVQVDGDGRMKKSASVEYISSAPQLKFTYNKRNKELVFSGTTQYEIYNKYGEIMMRGYGERVDVANLSSEEYWLSFDNLIDKFTKK